MTCKEKDSAQYVLAELINIAIVDEIVNRG